MTNEAERSALLRRAERLLGQRTIATRRGPATCERAAGEPSDLGALYAMSDGLELSDGTRLLGRAEVPPATTWLTSEKALEWPADLWVVGERDDLVIVLDLDLAGARAGGGILEAATDELTGLRRVALTALTYLEEHAGLSPGGPPAPERAVRDAVDRRDASAIEAALTAGFYPGAEREAWHGGLTLGSLRAAAGDEPAALLAFSSAVEARANAAPRGSASRERAQAWKACAIAADKAGAGRLAIECRARATG